MQDQENQKEERTGTLKGSTITPKTAITFLTLGLFALAGCGGENSGSAGSNQDELPAAAQPMSPEVQELVNQGNEAQRAGDFEAALDSYRQAMEQAGDHPVPQFGALMAAMALEDQALVDSLVGELQVTSPELLAMLNPDGSMGGGMPANPHSGAAPGGMPGMATPEGAPGQVEGLPAGHPVLYDVTPDTVQPDTAGGR